MKNKNELNAKSIKKALKNYGFNVLNCYKGKGTTKKALTLVIKAENCSEILNFFNEFGIVSTTGKPFTKTISSTGVFSFVGAYMSDSMFNELNS